MALRSSRCSAGPTAATAASVTRKVDSPGNACFAGTNDCVGSDYGAAKSKSPSSVTPSRSPSATSSSTAARSATAAPANTAPSPTPAAAPTASTPGPVARLRAGRLPRPGVASRPISRMRVLRVDPLRDAWVQ